MSRRAPVPALWHIPEGKATVLLFTADEDGAAQDDNNQEMAAVESYNGHLSLYVIPGSTSITREHVEEYERRGHEISVHPNLVPTCEEPKERQLAKAEADVLYMRETFGVPVDTVRNHIRHLLSAVGAHSRLEAVAIASRAH